MSDFCRWCQQTREITKGVDSPAGFVCNECWTGDFPKWEHSQKVYEWLRVQMCDRVKEGVVYHGGGLRPGVDYLRKAFDDAMDVAIYLAAELVRRGEE